MELYRTKRSQASTDPEIFEALSAILQAHRNVIEQHLVHIYASVKEILNRGAQSGEFKIIDLERATHAVLDATLKFRHPLLNETAIYKECCGAMLLNIERVRPGKQSIPRWLAWNVAGFMEMVWRTTKRKDTPPITRTMVRLIGQELTFSDYKARTELGYTPIINRDAGLAELAFRRN